MKKILIVLLLVIGSYGCSSELSIKDNQTDLQSNSIALMHRDYFIRDVNFKNLDKFELSIVHYVDNKLVKKESLLLNEDHKSIDMDVLMAISLDKNNNKKFEASYLENKTGTSFDFEFKYGEQLVKNYYPKINLAKKEIVLGGIYYNDNAFLDANIKELCTKECLLFVLDKLNK